MRHILTDRHRARQAAKRTRPDSASGRASADPGVLQRIDIQIALEKLAQMSPRQASIVEMRFFRGMEIPEIARSIQMSEKTVQREWLAARAWLYAELTGWRLKA